MKLACWMVKVSRGIHLILGSRRLDCKKIFLTLQVSALAILVFGKNAQKSEDDLSETWSRITPGRGRPNTRSLVSWSAIKWSPPGTQQRERNNVLASCSFCAQMRCLSVEIVDNCGSSMTSCSNRSSSSERLRNSAVLQRENFS